MLAIFKREFKSLFTNVIGWVFVGINLFIYGLYYYAYNLSNGYPSIAPTLSAVSFILLFTVPILSMKVFAEERKNKTDQLIFTAPVSIFKVVLSKYLALLAAFAIDIGIIAISPLVLRIFGHIGWAENYIGLLGFFLFGAACIAVGVFVSSLTEHPVVSILVSVLLLFLGYMMRSLTSFIFGDNLLTTILNSYDLQGGFETMTNGLFSLYALVYYVALIFLFLFLTYMSVQKRRWVITKKVLGRTISKSALIIIVLVGFVVGNWGLTKIPEKYTEFDATSINLYKISDESKDYLKSYDGNATIYVLSKKSDVDDTVRKTLEEFDSFKNINVEYVNTEKKPNFYTKFTEIEPTAGSFIVVSDKRSTVVDYNDIYEYSYDSSYNYSVSAYDAEGRLISALQYIVSDDMPVIYNVTNHNESLIESHFTGIITKSNYELKDISLLTEDSIPNDCNLLIINGPKSDLSSKELDMISSYLDNGGDIMINLNFKTVEDTPNLKALLSKLDVSTIDGVVSDLESGAYYDKPYYLLPTVNMESTVSSDVNYVMVPTAVALKFNESNTEMTYTQLLNTSSDSFVKSDISGDFTKKEDSDVSGPLCVGLSVTTSSNATAYIFGSDSMFVDDVDTIVAKGNSTLFGNVVSDFLSDVTTNDTVYIPSKSVSPETLYVSDTAKRVYGIIWGLVLPFVSVLVGIGIWVARRRR